MTAIVGHNKLQQPWDIMGEQQSWDIMGEQQPWDIMITVILGHDGCSEPFRQIMGSVVPPNNYVGTIFGMTAPTFQKWR